MAETTLGGYYIGADGKPHDAEGRPVALRPTVDEAALAETARLAALEDEAQARYAALEAEVQRQLKEEEDKRVFASAVEAEVAKRLAAIQPPPPNDQQPNDDDKGEQKPPPPDDGKGEKGKGSK